MGRAEGADQSGKHFSGFNQKRLTTGSECFLHITQTLGETELVMKFTKGSEGDFKKTQIFGFAFASGTFNDI